MDTVLLSITKQKALCYFCMHLSYHWLSHSFNAARHPLVFQRPFTSLGLIITRQTRRIKRTQCIPATSKKTNFKQTCHVDWDFPSYPFIYSFNYYVCLFLCYFGMYYHCGPFTTTIGCVVFEVLTAVAMKCTIFWDITPCSPLKVNRCFGGTLRLYLLVTCFQADFLLG
jgi:hypothetical protein